MAGFDVIRHPTFQEVAIDGDLSLPMLREILAEVGSAEHFLQKHALWVFGPRVRPLAYHEFDDVVAMLEKLYTRRPAGKRVALVVPDSFSRSVAGVFLAQAARLPVQMRVFDDRTAALAWLVG